eukprot:9479686-Pyramimonas_sp.AAC.1
MGRRLGLHDGTGVDAKVSHVFSAELDEQKRSFLMDMYDMSKNGIKLYGDVKNLDKLTAPDYAGNRGSGKGQEVPESAIGEFDILFAGFPCKDASDYNTFREKHRKNVCMKIGKTGKAFSGILGLLNEHGAKTLLTILENVKGLAVPPTENGEKKTIHESNLAAT